MWRPVSSLPSPAPPAGASGACARIRAAICVAAFHNAMLVSIRMADPPTHPTNLHRHEAHMTRFPELDEGMRSVDAWYKQRGIFQDRFGFGKKPAVVVVDFANGWTDDAYAGGSRRLDSPVENTARLLEFIRSRQRPVPIVYTTSPWHPDCGDQPFKSAADKSPNFRTWDEHACQIDARVAPTSRDLVIEKENASAFFGTHLIGYLIQHAVDTLLITGCSTSACIRATATDG